MKTLLRVIQGAALLLVLLASASQSARADCPNEAVRVQQGSTHLPDCRGFELVTPPDTAGRVVGPISSFSGAALKLYELFPTELASPLRDSFVFMLEGSPLRTPNGANGNWDVYETLRSEDGWHTSRRVSLPGDLAVTPRPGGVSADNLYTFGGSEASVSYLGEPDGSFELTGQGSLGEEPFAQGRYITAGGNHVIFSTGRDELHQSFWCSREGLACKVHPLEEDAPPEGTGAVYDRSANGATHVISLLPGDHPPEAGEEAYYRGASKDGTSVAFEIEGTLYVRVDNGSEDERTQEVASGEPVYAGLSDDGGYLFYVLSGTVHRFDTGDESDVQVNPTGEAKIVNVSADGSHVYFISEQQLDGSKGVADQPNLYVWREGSSPRYIATVLPSDEVRTSEPDASKPSAEFAPALTNWTSWVTNPSTALGAPAPGADSSRTTPDGEVLVFESKAQLGIYNNAGHTEIYRYDDAAETLTCVSCGSMLQPASGDARLQELVLANAQTVIHNLSADGARVFFETDQALIPNDTDGINDIYEWQEQENGSPTINLISSGRSPHYRPAEKKPGGVTPSPFYLDSNVLLSVTPSGGDVMFMAEERLVASGPTGGTPAIYDARVGGGFLDPAPPAKCVEEGCRPAGGSAPFPPGVIRSENLSGGGNVKPRKHRRHHRRSCHRSRNGKKPKRCSKHNVKKPSRKGGASASSASTGAPPPASEVAASASQVQEGQATTENAPVGSTLASVEPLRIEKVRAETSTTEAGSHPDFTTTVSLNHQLSNQNQPFSDIRTEDVVVSLPPGLLGNPNAVPRCEMGFFVAHGNCPPDAQVGIAKLAIENFGRPTEPIYNLTPPQPDREIARFGFIAGVYPVTLEVSVRSAGDYGATVAVRGGPALASLIEARTVFWGDPASSSHDKERLTPIEAIECNSGTACKAPEGKRPSGIPVDQRKAFMTNPSACQGGSVDFTATSYQYPGQAVTESAPLVPVTDCVGLPFSPSLEAEPISHVAGAATGLKAKLLLPQHLRPGETSTATMREARVTLPAGMQIAAGAANWIGTCSEDQVGFHQEVDADCPDSSKLGTAKIFSPFLPEPIEGAIYQRTPTPGHQFGLWLTADALGLHIKLPGELEPDKQTGRLTAVFRDLPQVPVEEIELNVWGGPRAPLENPDACGTYTTNYTFSPHSNDPAVSGSDEMTIDQGCDQGFSPTLHAGVTKPFAGAFSPFVFDLNREDGQQALRGFELHLPDGELAKIKGVPLCPDDAAAAGTCPAASRIGSLQATTGPGPDPLQVPQPGKPVPQIYLAGPYQGAPFSIVSQVPAQAGPFDLGVLAVRSGLEVDPETGRATVKADPLPQSFEGVGIAYRHLHAVVDRPEFSLNPTDCREAAVTSDVTSTTGTVAHPQARFQIDGCKALKFKPKLSLKLKGGTKRADYPALTAVLKARKGDANIAFTSVALPHSEFLAQEHIGTICTRKQFAVDKCPKGSVYGKAKAWTPLLDKPLSGPVHLRSSDNPLPDMVVKLGGQLEIHLVGRIDSVNGGIRTTFKTVPDAPVSKFVLKMKGGKKGLLTNSTDVCRGAHRATAVMRAQNGRAANLRPRLVTSGCGSKKLVKHKR
jgi:hypothetical protein